MAFAAYTSDSLAVELRGQVNASVNAPGGTVPDRVMKAVHHAGIKLWAIADWDWRRVVATLTLADAACEQDAPNDFAKFDQQWLKETDAGARLRIYSDVRRYLSMIDGIASTDTGEPAYLTAVTESSSAPHKWEFNWKPKCDADYTYPYCYLRCNPWQRILNAIADNEAPNWPVTMDEGWKRLATAMVAEDFSPGSETAKGKAKTFQDWLRMALGNIDETVAGGDDEPIGAGYDDVNAFASNALDIGGARAGSGSISNSWGDAG